MQVYVGLGSNLGDRQWLIAEAVAALQRLPQTTVRRLSSLHETEPVGGPPQGRYLNAVAALETTLTPGELLAACQAIERALGRQPSPIRGSPRPIDLDILFYGTEVIQEEGLIVPHPRLWERSFVLQPLGELAPALAAAGPARWREVFAEGWHHPRHAY